MPSSLLVHKLAGALVDGSKEGEGNEDQQQGLRLVQRDASLDLELAQDALAGDGLANQRCTGTGEASGRK